MNAIAINEFSQACVKIRSTLNVRDGKEVLDNLSNQAAGFPVRVNGIRIETVEHLYHALKFSDPDIQKEILSRKTPSTCKRIPPGMSGKVREDWEVIKQDVMRYCLRVKLVWNSRKFGMLLRQMNGFELVCDGDNTLGQLLMELRDEYLKNAHSLYRVEPPELGLVFMKDPLEVIDRKKLFKNHDYVSPYEGMY